MLTKSFTSIFLSSTLAEIPKPPLVKVLKITPKTALVEWRRILPNKDLYGDLLGYKIVLDSQNQSLYFKKSIDTVQIPLEDLSPNTSYNFTIRGYTQNEDGLISDVKFFTTLGKHFFNTVIIIGTWYAKC